MSQLVSVFENIFAVLQYKKIIAVERHQISGKPTSIEDGNNKRMVFEY